MPEVLYASTAPPAFRLFQGKLASRKVLIAAAVAASFAVSTTPSARAALTFTSRAAFTPAVKSGAYTETFDSLGDGDFGAPNKTFASGGFSFTASTGASLNNDNDLFGADGATIGDYELSTTIPSNLTFTFPSGNVTAVGGDFALTDPSFSVVPDTFTLTLSDGTTVTRTSGGTNTPFFGFTSTVPITSLTFAIPSDAASSSYYATVNNLTVGTASVPEPASLALGAVGVVALLGRRRARTAVAR